MSLDAFLDDDPATHDSSSNIVDVIFPKIHSTKNVAAASCEDLIITPFAQILLKLG